MSIPPRRELSVALLEVIRDLGGQIDYQAQKGDLLDRLRTTFPEVTEQDVVELTPGGSEPRFQNAVRWARNHLVNDLGYINGSERGRWGPITVEGHRFLASRASVATVEEHSVSEPLGNQNPERDILNTDTPLEALLDGLQASADVPSRLRARLLALTPRQFEHLVASFAERCRGLVQVHVTQGSGDRGVDVIADRPAKPFSRRVAIQAKLWKGVVGRPEIQAFRGAIQGEFPEGMFVTIGRFTSEASDEAERPGAIRIELVNGATLIEELIQHKVGLKLRTVELRVRVDRQAVDEEFFSSLDS